jgi:hypothetical protein
MGTPRLSPGRRPGQQRRLTLDDIEITLPSAITFSGSEVANILHHGGPLAIAERLADLAADAPPALRDALLELAHQVEPGPIPEVLARSRIRIQRQPDYPATAEDPPTQEVWGPEMARHIGERWLRRQLGELGEAS